MPAQYLAIKRKKKKEGMSDKEAKKHAAMIYNSKHPDNPVGRYTESFCNFMEGYLKKSTRQSVAYNLKSMKRGRDIAIKDSGKVPHSDIETAFAHTLYQAGDRFEPGSKPYSTEDHGTQDAYYKAGNSVRRLADKLRIKEK